MSHDELVVGDVSRSVLRGKGFDFIDGCWVDAHGNAMHFARVAQD